MNEPGFRRSRARTPDGRWFRGNVERRACEDTRHGTRAFLLRRQMVTGKLLAPHAGPTRTEEAVLAPVPAVVATDPQAIRWQVVCDHLTIHPSESLVRFVAQISGIEQDVGKQGDDGILALMPRRAAFLSDPTTRSCSMPPPSRAPG